MLYVKSITRHQSITYLIIALVLASYTHLWNPLGFPAIYIDESHYMRRAMQVLQGQGPQETITTYDYPYDHPYFGQIFLASMLYIIGYPDSLNPFNPNEKTITSIEKLHMIPRILIGLIAILDTFLVYKIALQRYGQKVAFISSVIFAIMPFTWSLRWVLLETLCLPFLLSSVLFALYLRGKEENMQHKRSFNKIFLIIVFSGIFLGLSIFTKVSMVVFILPIAVIVYTNTKSFKQLLLWFIPVLVIPLIWPAYAMYNSEFNEWAQGVLHQEGRTDTPVGDILEMILNVDPLLLGLGIAALIYSEVKRDYLPIMWIVPYIIFISLFGGIVKHFHFIPLFPILSIVIGRLLVDFYQTIKKHGTIPKISSCAIILFIFGFAFTSTHLLITLNLNSSYFSTYSTVIHNLPNDPNGKEMVTMIGQHSIRNYYWIPKHVLDIDNHVKDVYPPRFLREPLQTEKVLLIINNPFNEGLLDENNQGEHLKQLRSLVSISISKAEITQKWEQNRDIYPYTSLKENSGIGSKVRVMSNY